MNALHPLAVCAVVCAHRKIPLAYLGDLNMWLAVCWTFQRNVWDLRHDPSSTTSGLLLSDDIA